MPKISLIAAISDNNVLAKNGKIPWKIPSDIQRYRGKIREHVAIFGRKTFDESYTDTVNIVVTHSIDYQPPIASIVVNSIDKALEKALSEDVLQKASYKDEIYIIGGGEIFKETIAIVDKLYLTVVHQVIDGNTFFPDYYEFKKKIFKESREENGYKFTYLDLER